MSLAAKQVRGLLGIASVAAIGWCSAAGAQPAPKEPSAPNTQPSPKAQPAPKTQPPAPKSEAASAPKKAPLTVGKPAAAPTKTAGAPASNPPTPDQKAATPATTASEGERAEPTKGEEKSWVPPSSATTDSPTPGTDGPASPWPEGAANASAAATSTNPPVYYVDQPPTDRPPVAAAPGRDIEPASNPMRFPIEEPPVPPPQRHTAPRSALWLGARVGYFVPFGDLWGRCAGGYEGCSTVEGASFSDVAASGPMFELDVGARLGRNYVIYLGWERAQLGSADGPSPDPSIAVNQLRSESDFFALGFRLSADPDDVGLLLDLAIGARRFRAYYEDSTELQLTQAPLESRLGIGVEIRTNRRFSLSPMLTLGIGSFGKADWVNDAYVQNAIPANSDRLTHGWVTLQLGGHFDLIGND